MGDESATLIAGPASFAPHYPSLSHPLSVLPEFWLLNAGIRTKLLFCVIGDSDAPPGGSPAGGRHPHPQYQDDWGWQAGANMCPQIQEFCVRAHVHMCLCVFCQCVCVCMCFQFGPDAKQLAVVSAWP